MIGKQLKKLRETRNINQTELSEILGVVRSQISMYESDERDPSPEVLMKIVKYFNCSIDYLYGLVENKNDTTNPLQDIVGFAEKSQVHADALRSYIEFLKSQNKQN